MKFFYTASEVNGALFTERILRERYGIPNPRLARTQNGKPYLPDSPLYFNLSHSGNVTALAVANAEVGLDIELRKERKIPALLRRLTPEERNEDFFKLWTAKESYIKYRGGTLAKTLSALEYKNGVLYENGRPVSAHFCFTELENCAVCICTAEYEEVVPVKL